MKKHLQRILSLLCILAMVFGTVSALAEATEEYKPTEGRAITVDWKDEDDYDGIRPEFLEVKLADQSVTLNADNGWTGEVTVPADTENKWEYTKPEGYAVSEDAGAVTVLKFQHDAVDPIKASATVNWNDSENAGKIRPDSVQLMLYADDEPCGAPQTAKAPAWTVTWDGLRKYQRGTKTEIKYTVAQLQTPEGYVSAASGLEVTNTLQTATLTLTASVSGAPEGADLSALTLTVDGPDPSMPQTLTWAQISGGSYSFGTVLPGAYLVRNTNADLLVEGYTTDAANSLIADSKYAKPGESAALSFKYTYKLPEAIEDLEEDYDPWSNVSALTFEILGPDARMPMTITYAQFTDGKYELADLVPGVYTVIERNAEALVKYYTLTGASVTGMKLEVTPEGTATAKLYNQYTPAPTPEPEAEFVDIPVTKTWNDNNNKDGNRPDSITVRLYADGVEVDNHVLTAGENWSYTFTEKPHYKEDNKTEIVYTVNEDAVAMYAKEINGYNIVNNYQPETTSISVIKIWQDNNNAQNRRPASIAMTLSDGQKEVKTVVLNEANNWTATVNDLPTVVNGMPAKYAWKEQQVIGYTLTSVTENGNTMTFTNAVWERPENPPTGKKPKTPGETWFVFEEYDTPLGVEVVINHVGDCFD